MEKWLKSHSQTLSLILGLGFVFLSYLWDWHLALLTLAGIFLILALFGHRITEITSRLFGIKMAAGLDRRATLASGSADGLTVTSDLADLLRSIADALRRSRPSSPEELAEQIASAAVASVGIIVPGQVSSNTATVTVSMDRPLAVGTTTVRVALETPGVTFVGTPTLVASIAATVTVEPGGRVVVLRLSGPTATPPTVTITGLKLSASAGTIPGAQVQASVAVDGSYRRAIVGLGTIGAPPDLLVLVASATTVLLGGQGQTTGLITIIERGPGALVDSGILRCRLVDMSKLDSTGGDGFTNPPWMIVTIGDLKLLGSGGSGATTVRGRVSDDNRSAAEWTIFAGSTIPSTFEIRGAGPTDAPLASGPLNGPLIDIGPSQAPGTVGLMVDVLDAARSVPRVIGVVPIGFRDAPAS